MKNFTYKRVATIEEALSLLSRHSHEARILAGGTDLLLKMKLRAAAPEIIIDIKGIRGYDEIRCDHQEGLLIGSLATLRSIETSPIVQEKFSVLAETAALFGSIQIRNRATLGGNLCNASPSAEIAACLMSLGARARIVGSEGDRWVPLDEFFAGPGETVLRPDEVLASVQVPNIPARTGCVYVKHSIRKAMDTAIVGVAVALTLDGSESRCTDVRIVLGAVAPSPMRARKAEERLRGREMDGISIAEAARLASQDCRPITDVRASADYRKEMIEVLTEAALRKAMDTTGWGEGA
jgi:carbon-monoxide dehydrogenase medium subunit